MRIQKYYNTYYEGRMVWKSEKLYFKPFPILLWIMWIISDSPLLYSGNRPYLVWGMMTSHLLRGLGLSRRWRLDVGEQKQGMDMETRRPGVKTSQNNWELSLM